MGMYVRLVCSGTLGVKLAAREGLVAPLEDSAFGAIMIHPDPSTKVDLCSEGHEE